MSARRDRIWKGLVAIYTLLTLVAVAGALGSTLNEPPVHMPQLVPGVAASERSRTVAGPIPGSELVGEIPLGRHAIRVPILEYHYVRVVTNRNDILGYNLSVTPTNFAAQMNWLATRDYHPITLSDLRSYFAGQTALPARPVVLTFDDGYQNFWNIAEPILLTHAFKAVAYIVPGFWGQSFYMSPAEILELDRSGMVEIASHTMNHADLATTSAANRAYQLAMSRSSLEQLLGHPVLDFCYPSGKFNAAAVTAVGNAGYETATTEMPGMTLSWSTRLLWPRVRVGGGESLAAFVANLGQPEPTVNVLVPPAPVPSPQTGAF